MATLVFKLYSCFDYELNITYPFPYSIIPADMVSIHISLAYTQTGLVKHLLANRYYTIFYCVFIYVSPSTTNSTSFCITSSWVLRYTSQTYSPSCASETRSTNARVGSLITWLTFLYHMIETVELAEKGVVQLRVWLWSRRPY